VRKQISSAFIHLLAAILRDTQGKLLLFHFNLYNVWRTHAWDEISLTHADDNHDIGRRCGIFSCRVPNNDACFVVSCLL